ncbi:MAG TPA: MotA/TolQ/ExbB proton channel family protein [Chitinophagales bacterium]|nr:MotA/TolQ/ExbB proton channel family protein [Chitinophagales bacterium]HMU98342.1 MotA/TolQ/ExbB proton channel family protein [Chitinophagales bacterium]HMV02140.1 MotA/TolQ/ExbB proton channel family protein [Chitinophagales bacterium]HMW93940.1 MotA/TolQ/ExbB proton channel family protein [Chitinophagales bacterium]HMY42678.1 MotA/TolQ/ExbB proton channel family protein [Chitinophagales bacterium]
MAQAQTTTKKQSGLNSGIVILIATVLCNVIFYTVFAKQFDEQGHHTNVLGLVYKGGFVVPFLLATFIICITFAVERLLTINKAKGTGDLDGFLRNIKSKLVSNDINGALADCAKQQGSVANVVQAGLHKYAEMEKNTGLDAEQKVMNIQKEIEETTGLELPVLEKNMWILATIASVGTLIALFGTVLGMIKAFTGLAASGSPDPEVLATGISEALINTAIGIITSAVAIIFYNLCTNMIDKLTYGIDEMGYSISQTFAAKNK